MAFSLIDDTAGALPLTIVTKKGLPACLNAASELERNWLTSTGFSAEQGKIALLPAENGRLARVVAGIGAGSELDAGMSVLPRRATRRDLGNPHHCFVPRAARVVGALENRPLDAWLLREGDSVDGDSDGNTADDQRAGGE